MNFIFYKLFAALLIFGVGMATAIYPLLRQRVMKPTEPAQVGEALASGIFLGAAFFHMLPDAVESFHAVYSQITYPVPELVCVGGFIFMLFLERLSLTHDHHHDAPNNKYVPIILTFTLVIHALTEGAALGIGNTLPQTTMLFIAILAHKGSASYALCVMLLRHNLSFKTLLGIVTFFALMTPLGILIGAGIGEVAAGGTTGLLIASLFKAFAAGTFLYISTLHHVHFHTHTHEKQGLLEFASLVGGTMIMALIALWA